MQDDLTPVQQAMLFMHDLAAVSGFEFALFSNVRLDERLCLPGEIIIVPCFLPGLSHDTGDGPSDKKRLLTRIMEIQSAYVYDGWLPIRDWDTTTLSCAIRTLDEAIAGLSFVSRGWFRWEPKYSPTHQGGMSLLLAPRGHETCIEILRQLRLLPPADPQALNQAMGWLLQARQVSNAAAELLFAIFSMETLADYVENAPAESRLRCLCPSKPSSKASDVEECIRTVWEENGADDPVGTIRIARAKCLSGSPRTLVRAHLESVFGASSPQVSLLFEQHVNMEHGRTRVLWQLRDYVAHGVMDALS